VAAQWLTLLEPVLRYSSSRDAYVLRGVGHHRGPVLREDRRLAPHPPVPGRERRRTRTA
jgi:hypothetical protein